MSGTHTRNTGPMRQSLRCGARTRKGAACEAPAVAGKKRCRMHGGAQGSGAQRGNQNAFKHGHFTREEREFRRHVRELLESGREMIEKF